MKRLVAMCFPLAARQRIAEEKAQLLECIGVELVKRQCAMTDRFIDTHLEFCTVVPLAADMRKLPAPDVPVSESQIVHPAFTTVIAYQSIFLKSRSGFAFRFD